MAKSKGHVSPPASERGNYPFPVREQQMIANYGGAFSGAEICQKEGEGGLIFWQLHIYFYHVFFPPLVICCFFFCSSHELAQCRAVCLCLRASEGVFMCPALTYLFIVLHFLTVIFFFFSVVTISQIIYCPSNFPFSICVFYLSEKAVNGGKIITITHIIEPSL